MGRFLIYMALCLGQPDLIVLDNGYVRVEIDPSLFVVRYVGPPGGPNFVTPLFVDKALRSEKKWVDAGGLYSDLLHDDHREAALRGGPATVIERRDDYVALLGPVTAAGVRLKKEIRLARTGARAWYKVTALAVSETPSQVAIRNTVRVPLGTTLRTVAEDDTLGAIAGLAGLAALEPVLAAPKPFWRISVPPKAPLDGVVLGAMITEIAHDVPWGTWFRRVAGPLDEEGDFLQDASFLCLLDDGAQRFCSVLQGPLQRLAPSSPVVFEEEWRFEKRRP